MGDRALALADGPVLGLNGTAEGAALLRDFPRVAEAMRDAAQAKDGLLHGVRLGDDGVALAGADGVILAAASHPWAGRVQQATGASPTVPRFRIEGTSIVHVDSSALTLRPGSTQRRTLDEVLSTASGEVYLRRSMLTVENGTIVRDALPLDATVTVRAVTVADRPNPGAMASTPDVRIHEGVEWWRVSVPGSTAGPTSTPTPTPGNGAVPGTSGQILLVCPDTNDNLSGCE